MVFCSAHQKIMLLLRITAQGGPKKPKQVPAVMLLKAYLKACNKLLFHFQKISPPNTHFLNKYWTHWFFLLPLLFSNQLLPG